MSKLADDVYIVLKEIYPFDLIKKEYYIFYKNTRLFFDFYINNLNVCVECQGQQHDKFVSFFHNDIEDFFSQKRRDNLKVEYCNKNNLTLVYFYDKVDVINKELVLERIYEAMSNCNG